MPTDTVLTLLAIFALWNGIVFCVYAFDKIAATQGAWRVREDTLILLAVLGGGLGAFACQRLLRHKTRKAPFPVLLPLMAGLHIVIILLIALVPDAVLHTADEAALLLERLI
ncbi:MAG: DUF1294 domain-containing protein [Alphaproteobacteria bacterium]|uniref:DUF1294 domain-containing protein n=1 Tax=unclassified Rhizobium TaxID=2613769 RepID=UPI0006BA0A8F|nr:DUF1294 domain-containing protein [Rhizobium sp. AAP116]MBU0739985.1 DUF1294 domain-containing protein [Alphaproteobacteria bacterium]MDM7981106.1 DUF1294 domain-containing protein [Rhizobium sp.]KPF56194.1 hypothetical protein IP85_16025 [Rhizobium sp. AAP116]MBU0833528.1 DUF1294 domain-containing protein [Alphaproteobacteria bacterium]MBU1765097.1 DUF1294 domain-containing protein [Alphaproteobacteria bacterium]